MLDNFIYTNHLGQQFVGLENNVFMNQNDLRDYSWYYDIINKRITRFFKDITNRKIPLIVHCNSDDEAIEVKNKLFEIAEIDIEALKAGTIYLGEWYTKGYITTSSKSDYLISKRLCRFDLTLTSEKPDWFRETIHSFVAGHESDIGIGSGTDYPYEYEYDYALSQSGKKIDCGTFGKCEFKLLIYGEVDNPTVTIGGHNYKINGAIKSGETLLIDSLEKSITLTTPTGSTVNWFDKRNRDEYIFEPIPAGLQTVSWNGLFGFDLTIIEKRSEPKWT